MGRADRAYWPRGWVPLRAGYHAYRDTRLAWAVDTKVSGRHPLRPECQETLTSARIASRAGGNSGRNTTTCGCDVRGGKSQADIGIPGVPLTGLTAQQRAMCLAPVSTSDTRRSRQGDGASASHRMPSFGRASRETSVAAGRRIVRSSQLKRQQRRLAQRSGYVPVGNSERIGSGYQGQLS